MIYCKAISFLVTWGRLLILPCSFLIYDLLKMTELNILQNAAKIEQRKTHKTYLQSKNRIPDNTLFLKVQPESL